MERSSNIGSGVGGASMIFDATDRDMIERGDRIGAPLVRELLAHYDDAEARIAAAEDSENEAKDCFWAVYPEYLKTGGKPVSTEAARTMLADQAKHFEQLLRGRDEYIGSRGLWQDFVDSLPATPTTAGQP